MNATFNPHWLDGARDMSFQTNCNAVQQHHINAASKKIRQWNQYLSTPYEQKQNIITPVHFIAGLLF